MNAEKLERLLTSVNVMSIPYLEVSKHRIAAKFSFQSVDTLVYMCYMHFAGLKTMLLLPAYIACWYFVMGLLFFWRCTGCHSL